MTAAKAEVSQRCSQMVLHGYRRYSCPRKASIERAGKWYCKQHDPVAVEVKRKVRDAKWNAEWDAKRANEKQHKAIQGAKDAVVKAAKDCARLWASDGFHLKYMAARIALFDAMAKLEALGKVE